MDQTTEGLINLVKEKETIPDSGAAYSESTLLNYLDQSLKAFIVPAVESVLEEHFVVTIDTQMPEQATFSGNSPPTGVSNFLTIPSESTGLRLRDVYLVGPDGSFYNLPRLTPTQAASQNFGNVLWGPGYNNQNQSVGGFFLQGNTVQIFPYGLASGKLIRMTYQRAPADLCLTTDAGRVIDKTGDVCTLDKVLPWFGTLQAPTAATRVGVINGELPHEFVQNANIPVTVYTSYAPLSNVELVSVVGNVITLPAGTGANVVIGDWLCLRGQSVFAQNIPKELLPVLIQKAAEMCIHAAGDTEGQRIANAECTNMMKMALLQIAPRVIGKPAKILPVNSAFKAARGSAWGRY
jgi:hypothetical protein